MDECNSIEVPNIYPNLNDRQQFRLNNISGVTGYFIAEIRERDWLKGLVNILLLSIILKNL